MKKLSGKLNLISRNQFLEIYKTTRVLNLKMFEYFYRESSVDKIYLAPHALPHFRHKICEYGAYNIGEQKLIADFALKEFGIKTLPMPKDSIVTTIRVVRP